MITFVEGLLPLTLKWAKPDTRFSAWPIKRLSERRVCRFFILLKYWRRRDED